MPLFIKYNILRKLFLLKTKKVYFRKEKPFTFLQSKKEGLLKINKNIDLIFMNSQKNLINKDFLIKFNTNEVTSLTLKQQYFTKSLIFFYLKKKAFLNVFNHKIQYFYFIYNLISTYSISLNYLLKNEIFSFDNFLYNSAYKFSLGKNLFVNNFGFKLINNQKKAISLTIWSKYSNLFFSIFLKKYFSLLLNSNINEFYHFSPLLTTIDNLLINNFITDKKNVFNKRKIFLRKELISTLLGRNTNWNKFLKNTTWISFIFERLILNENNLNINLWKLNTINKKKDYNKDIKPNFFYFLIRLEEKLKSTQYSLTEKQTILALRNLYLKKLENKVIRKSNKGYLLSTLSFLERLGRSLNKKRKRLYAIPISKKKRHKILTRNKLKFFGNFLDNSNIQINNIKLNNLQNKLSGKKKYKKVVSLGLWKEKKLEDQKSFFVLKNLDKVFSLVLGSPTSLIFINALSLTKYGFSRKLKGAHRFLNRIERDLIQRFKYVAIYIQDFVRISFFSVFLKKPTFLANFIGFQLSKLPRNRKETQLIRFIIKVVRIFGAQRSEISGIKIEFKGRVNRWRRTKIIRGTRKVISYIRYNNRIEFGSSKAITRKGAIGIRIWFAYKYDFGILFREALISYISYSQALKVKKINQFLNQYN